MAVLNSQDKILQAFAIDGNGQGKELDEEAIIEEIRSEHFAWVHLNVNHPGTEAWLETNLGYLDRIIIEALLVEETRPRILVFPHGVLIILRGVNVNEKEDPEDMVSIRLWIDPWRVISLQRRKVFAVQDLAESLRRGVGPKNAADFLIMLCNNLFTRMNQAIADLDEQTDEAEEALLEGPDKTLREMVIDIRKKAILFRRYISPQKEVMAQLRNAEVSWMTQFHLRKVQENQDRITRYVEDLDAIRERAQIVKDELANILADHLNRNLYLLSVVAAIFLPLSFLTGLLGINVGGLPGIDNQNAFTYVSLICAGILILQIVVFRFFKWF